jgi:hypothetical protein
MAHPQEDLHAADLEVAKSRRILRDSGKHRAVRDPEARSTPA